MPSTLVTLSALSSPLTRGRELKYSGANVVQKKVLSPLTRGRELKFTSGLVAIDPRRRPLRGGVS